MEFWGVEVKSGQPLNVTLGEGKVLHLSQACLGEIKNNKSESVCLHITVEDKKLVLGTLHSERLPQQLFDLVFDKDFQVSHNWKNGSVYFYGYKADQPSEEHDDSDDFDSEEEGDELPLPLVNGKQEAKKEEKSAVAVKKDAAPAAAKNSGKQKVKIVEPSKADSEEDDSDDSDAMSEDSDDDEENNEDSSDDDDDDSDEEEETPKKQQSGKKRANDSAMKTPSTDKKAKIATTPQKTEGKKGGVHIATPHPSKGAVSKTTPANKSNQKSPATDGAHSCKSCNRNFKSDGALQSHNQAKHK